MMSWQNICPLLLLTATIICSTDDFAENAQAQDVRANRWKRQVPPGYRQSQRRSGELLITFINKSGRRVRLFQSSPYGHEIRYRFFLRPNEPKRVSVRPDNSFWVAYDVTTNYAMPINGRRRLETYTYGPGTSIDAKIGSTTLRPERVVRDRSAPRFLETRVILDESMIEHHGEDNIRNYTLLLMNMVARTFLHRTLGAPIFIAITDIQLMKTKPSYYRIIPDRPEISVASACRYASRTANNASVDFSLILTRENIGPAGYASMYTMCSKRSCALVKENGPDSAFVIAHEMAHALGIDHDEDDRCVRDNLSGGNLMVKKLFSTSSNYAWSRCSQTMIWQNMKYFTCLANKPKLLPSFKKSMDHFPGELMNRTEQCQHYHGKTARACASKEQAAACRYLWCHPNPFMPCRPVWWHSPLEGSLCAKGKWCMAGKCIIKIKRVPVDGGWSDWSKYTPKCDINSTLWVVQTRNRSCTNPRPQMSGKKCAGVSKQYRVLLPTKNGICKPFSLRNLMLNGQMDMKSIQSSGCTQGNTNTTKWTVYREVDQNIQVKSLNLSCNFESEGCKWTNSKRGIKEWNIGRGRTPSAKTGPSFDNTFKNASGTYLYFEASWATGTKPLRKGDRVILESPFILAPSVCLRFAYHMFGRDTDALEVYMRKGKHFKKVWHKNGNQGNKWLKATIDLSVNIEYQISIEAVRGASYYSDIAIDDIVLTPGLCGHKPKVDNACTTVCINEKRNSMIRRKLPEGFPCKTSRSKNNVCFKKVCQPVNCHGVIGGKKC